MYFAQAAVKDADRSRSFVVCKKIQNPVGQISQEYDIIRNGILDWITV